MAKKATKTLSVEPNVEEERTPGGVKATTVRKTDVPPKAKPEAKSASKPAKAPKPTATTTESSEEEAVEVHDGMIAERAYHLWKAGHPGGEYDHWVAAERELRKK